MFSMKILVCGDRHWIDYDMIYNELGKFPSDILVITGGAAGADSLADLAASSQGKLHIIYEADWKTYGRKAGPIRNSEMLGERPNMVLAFHDDIDNSRGTKDMVNKARQKLIPVKIYSHSLNGGYPLS